MNYLAPAPQPRRRIVVIGATSAIAEHCVRLWLQAGPAGHNAVLALKRFEEADR